MDAARARGREVGAGGDALGLVKDNAKVFESFGDGDGLAVVCERKIWRGAAAPTKHNDLGLGDVDRKAVLSISREPEARARRLKRLPP